MTQLVQDLFTEDCPVLEREPTITIGGDILHGDALSRLKEIPARSVNCCITSPPYWGLRDYGIENQIGAEQDLNHFLDKLVEVFREV